MKKNGFTILELLVGLVVAMLCMIMMLMTFKQISKVSLESSMDAEYDTQVQLGMLVLQKVIQNAGYGSGNAADIAVNADNNTLYLRFTPDLSSPNVITCQALVSENDLANKEYKLYLVTNNNCRKSVDGIYEAYSNIAANEVWDHSTNTKSPLISIRNKEITSFTPAVFTFNLQSIPGGKKCTPYGISKDNPSGTKSVTIKAQGQYITEKQIQSLICLNNI